MTEEWDAAKLGGSQRLNIVNPDLLEERAKLAFDKEELHRFSYQSEMYDMQKEAENFYLENESNMCGSFDEYEMTRDELLEHYWKNIKFVMENKPEWHLKNSELLAKGFSWSTFQQNINPLTLTQGMFVQSMYLLTSEEQRKKWVPPTDNLNILGCYA